MWYNLFIELSEGRIRKMRDTLITNFSREKLDLFRTAVLLYRDKDLYISDVAYDIYSRRLDNTFSLHCIHYKNLSEFWRLFDKLEESERFNEKLTELDRRLTEAIEMFNRNDN